MNILVSLIGISQIQTFQKIYLQTKKKIVLSTFWKKKMVNKG